MRGKTYVYTTTSFTLLVFAVLKNGFSTVIMCRSVLGLSVLIAIIGIVQIIRIWKNDNKILNALDSCLLLLNILLIIINSFWLWITTFKDGM